MNGVRLTKQRREGKDGADRGINMCKVKWLWREQCNVIRHVNLESDHGH